MGLLLIGGNTATDSKGTRRYIAKYPCYQQPIKSYNMDILKIFPEMGKGEGSNDL